MHRGGELPLPDPKAKRRLTRSTPAAPFPLGRVLLEQLRDIAFEAGQAGVNLDHLVRADGVRWIHVRPVLGPLGAAITPMKNAEVDLRTVEVKGGVGELPSTHAPAYSGFQTRLLQCRATASRLRVPEHVRQANGRARSRLGACPGRKDKRGLATVLMTKQQAHPVTLDAWRDDESAG